MLKVHIDVSKAKSKKYDWMNPDDKTRLIFLNPDHIKSIELDDEAVTKHENHYNIIKMMDGEVIENVLLFKRCILSEGINGVYIYSDEEFEDI